MIQADELNMSRRLVALVVMGEEGAEGAGKGSWSGCPFKCFDPLVEAAVVDGQHMGDVGCGWAVQECLEEFVEQLIGCAVLPGGGSVQVGAEGEAVGGRSLPDSGG